MCTHCTSAVACILAGCKNTTPSLSGPQQSTVLCCSTVDCLVSPIAQLTCILECLRAQGWCAAHRCPMHVFTLLICSMLGFPWAKALAGAAQQMALYLSTDKAALDSLAAIAQQLGLSVHVSPCNLSQVQSVHACLQSLLGMQPAIRQALSKYPDAFSHLQVCSVIAALQH